ncbi:MAG: hypothetical protein WAK88_15895 [Candidatus Cybelea sp.]
MSGETAFAALRGHNAGSRRGGRRERGRYGAATGEHHGGDTP